MFKSECPCALKHRADDNKNETSGVHNIFLFCYYGELKFLFRHNTYATISCREIERNKKSARFILKTLIQQSLFRSSLE
ncbi:hypothetical protein P243_2646 [Klebsiella pneumoniae subsp. pneumoniae 1158]|nr:hypothetical protein P243_2646 [Klebsiella pneumoniae subsp. pneumoniae 1158]